MREGKYHTAEVCLDGHCTTPSLERRPELRSQYCTECGSKTITQCPNCSANIRGRHVVPNVVGPGTEYKPPNYCHSCGKPLPWTERKISAAQELVEEIEELSEDEKEILKQSIFELSQDSPRTELASIRYKKLLSKCRDYARQSLNSTVTSILTESAKKLLGL